MKRKIIQIGESTVLVSIPFKWAKKYNFKKGETIDITEKDNKIIIETDKKPENEIKKASFDINNLHLRTVKYAISALHKAGYDEITLHYKEFNPEINDLIDYLTKDLLLSFIVTEETNNKAVLRNVSNEIESEFNPALRRAFLVALSLANSSLDTISSGKFNDLKPLMNIDNSIDQLTGFCLRLMNKGLYNDEKNKIFMATIIWNLEKIADEYKGICLHLADTKESINKEILKLYKEVNDFFHAYYELVYNFSTEKLNGLCDVRDKLFVKLGNLKPKIKGEVVIVSRLTAILSKVADISSSIVGMNLEKL